MEDITVEELKQKIDNNESFVFIDVREDHEYTDFNLGADLIPLGTLNQNLEKYADKKEEEVIVHCRSGKRSAMAKQMMIDNGFQNVRNLLGGVLEWNSAFHS